MNNRQYTTNGFAQRSVSGTQIGETNPHTLWKQIAGLGIGSVIFFFCGGILLVLAGISTFVDAWTAGIYKKKDVKSFLNISPMAWGIAMEGLLIVAYPLYLTKRNKLKTKDGENIFWVSTIIFGGIPFLLGSYQIISRIAPIQTLIT